MYAGVDWARKGWFAVFISHDGDLEANVYPTLWNLWYEHGDKLERLLIDIPIGLCKDTKRACDVSAKRYLGSELQGSVFYTPVRAAVDAKNIRRAKAVHERADVDFGIQNQAWSLVPRIREADAFVADCSDSDVILETHPEACFVALNGGSLDTSKQDEAGIEARLSLVNETVDFDVHDFYEEACREFRKPSWAPMIGAKDDIVDALVAAATAASTDGDLPSLPFDGTPDYDTELERYIEIKLPIVPG